MNEDKIEIAVRNEQIEELMDFLRERCDKPAYAIALCIGAMFACQELIDTMGPEDLIAMVRSHREVSGTLQ